MFKHYLITRLLLSSFNPVKEEKAGVDGDWLDFRLDIFEKYTVPSVLRQTTTNFKWVLLVDPSHLLLDGRRFDRIKTYLDFCDIDWRIADWNRPFRHNEPISFRNFAIPKVNNEWLISSRLDSDDIICRDYIETLQECWQPNREIIYIKRGYVIDLDKGVARLKDETLNPFLTLSEFVPSKKIRGVYAAEHCHLRSKFAPRRVIGKKKVGWGQICHGRNLANTISSKNPRMKFISDTTVEKALEELSK
jgi:hypothetical protein